MNPFSVVSYCQNNLPSLPSIHAKVLQRRTQGPVLATTYTSSPTLPAHRRSSLTPQTTTLPLPEETIEPAEETKETESKPRNNPHAIIAESFPNGHCADSILNNNNNNNGSLSSSTLNNRHSFHSLPVPSPADPGSAPTVQTLGRASLDSLDRARIVQPSPTDTAQSTTMVSQPRTRHVRSSSSPCVFVPGPLPVSSPLSQSMPCISTSADTNVDADTDTDTEAGVAEDEVLQEKEVAKQLLKVVTPMSISIEYLRTPSPKAASPSPFVSAASTPVPSPPVSPVVEAYTKATLPMPDAPSSPVVAALKIATPAPPPAPARVATIPPSAPQPVAASVPVAAPVPAPAPVMAPSPVSTPPSAPATPTVPAVAGPPPQSFLSAWHGRSRAMIPSIPRPSPLAPFRAARRVVGSVTTAGTGYLPSKEQLGSIPVAGRILKHPAMDSTLNYIASKTIHRGGAAAVDSKLIPPEDVAYRKLNKKLVHQAISLSVLAIQKEEQSKAIDDEAGDDAFELYLAAIATLMHSLPFETCDPLRREAFVTQMRDFLDEIQANDSDDEDNSNQRRRRRRRRRHRHHHDQATSLIHHHTFAPPTVMGGPSQLRHQQQQPPKLVIKPQVNVQGRRDSKAEKERVVRKSLSSVSATASEKSSSSRPSSRRGHRSSRRQRRQDQYPENEDLDGNQAGGLGDTIINTAVNSAIRLKQSPIPDVVKSCFRTSRTILSKVDERFHLQEKAWELSKQSIEKAIELDEQYAIHEVVTETFFATVTGLVKAGIAYKETPSYAAVRGGQQQTQLEDVAAPTALPAPATTGAKRPLQPQGPTKAQQKMKQQQQPAPVAAKSNNHRRSKYQSESESDSEESASDSRSSSSSESSDEYDSDASSSSCFTSASDISTTRRSSNRTSVSSSSTAPTTTTISSKTSSSSSTRRRPLPTDEVPIELNRSTLRSMATPSTLPPPYSEQVRQKIDLFMAMKGAAALLVGSL